MSAFAALLSARYRERLQYRAAALAGIGTQFFWGFIRIMVLEAFYRAGGPVPLDFEQVVAYVWLGQAFFALLPINHDRELEAMIRSGQLAYELARPVDLYGLWYARALALRTSAVTLRFAPIALGAGLVLPFTPLADWALGPPASLAAGLLAGAGFVVAFALSAAITALVHVSLLYTISGAGVAHVMPALVMVGSGMVIPLPLFPDWAQPLLLALPLRGLADSPYRAYVGDLAPAQALLALAHALGWTLALVLLGRVLLARATRRVVVQGG